jgi:hypothetical protein
MLHHIPVSAYVERFGITDATASHRTLHGVSDPVRPGRGGAQELPACLAHAPAPQNDAGLPLVLDDPDRRYADAQNTGRHHFSSHA